MRADTRQYCNQSFVVLCELDMPLPLTILGSKYGTATKQTLNGFKINLPLLVTASVLIVLFSSCLSPIDGAQAAVSRVESNEDVADLQNLGQRQKRAAVTPLGKRLTTKLVAELGTRPRHLYSFGIGQ